MYNEESQFLELLDFAYSAAGGENISLLNAKQSTFKEPECLWETFWWT